jgi:hypothetical protein
MKRKLIVLVVLLSILCASVATDQATTYETAYGLTTSSQPIRLIAPWPAGQWWQPSTYDGHPPKNALDFNKVTNVREEWPYADGVEDKGEPIRAAHDGVVIFVRKEDLGGYGKYVDIQSSENSDYFTRYAHLDSVMVNQGDFVTAGQVIGTCGETGKAYGPHLHFELRHKTQGAIPILEIDGQPIEIDFSRKDSLDRYLGRPIQSRSKSSDQYSLADQYPNLPAQAPTVPPGTYSDGGGTPNDPRDCLAIQVSQGQRIILELTGPPGTDFDLRVYKPSNTSRASWESVKGNTSNERIIIDSAPETGRYVICIRFASGSGVWSLAIKVESGVSLPPPPSQPPATPTLPPPKPPLKGATTASALVMDVSGSMGWTWQGEVKLESAKRVASQTISLIEGEARASGAGHSLAIVSFSDQANLLLPLTTDYRRAKGVVLTLSPQASTNLGAGLQMALAELAKAPAGSQKYITLLSDGHITSGMSEGEVLAGPVAQARQRKICIHTVGFGDPNYLKEDFLKMISQQSGCGKYLYAKNAFELTNAYIKLRHLSLGGSIAEFISQAKIYEGETLTLGVVSLPGPRAGQEIEELHFTLTWSGSRLQPRLFDPAGVEVTEGYPGAQITYFEQFAHVAVRQPQPGFWKVVIFGEEVPPQGSDFYAVLSTRPGKLATIIPVINPVICFKYPSGEERCRYLLQGNIPTWRIIIGNIATLAVLAVIVAVVIYLRLSGQIP